MSSEIINQAWPEWRVVKVLGKGSYGVVYEAERMDNLTSTRSAIKVITIPTSDFETDQLRSEGMTAVDIRTYFQEIVDDFINEIRMMESFKGNNNIVSIEDYKLIESENRISWTILIRMELLTSFNTYIKSKKLSEDEVITLGCDICSALELCQKLNIVHRDIKPENLFVNNFGNFKLGDFGVARTMENLSSGLSMKGTYRYMAPEVEKGLPYGSNVDLYSLGLVLYRQMNKNRLPFVDLDKQIINSNEQSSALIRRLRGDALPPPCEASPEFARVILKACEPDPAARYQTAEEMKSDLLAVRENSKEDTGNPDIIKTKTLDRERDETLSVPHHYSNPIPPEPFKKESPASAIPPRKRKTRNPAPGLFLIVVIAAIIVIAVSSMKLNQSTEKDNTKTSETIEETDNISDLSIPADESKDIIQAESTLPDSISVETDSISAFSAPENEDKNEIQAESILPDVVSDINTEAASVSIASEENIIVIGESNFPDKVFRDYISENFDSDGDGSLSNDEINAITEIVVNGKNINSLIGIQEFPNLKRLIFYENNVSSLDVSNNHELLTLDCDSNNLTELDLTGNDSLMELSCNNNSFSELDVSHCSFLTVLNCAYNDLVSLDMSHNPYLEQLRCDHNMLETLDLSNNPLIEKLLCSDNSISTLVLAVNANLKEFSCDDGVVVVEE